MNIPNTLVLSIHILTAFNEDENAYLLSPEEVRILLSQYEVVKPFMERFYGPDETPPKGSDDKEGENKPKKS